MHSGTANVTLTEALLDLRFVPPEGLRSASLRECQAGETERYPVVREMTRTSAEVEAGGQLRAAVSSESVGFLFLSADEKRVFQAKRDGFTFNHLAPYPGWDVFRTEAARLWRLFRQRLAPGSVTRLGIRFISRVDIPGGLGDVARHLRTHPTLAPDLGASPTGFFMQVRVPVPEHSATLLLNEAVVAPAGPGVVSVVLDVDLFRDERVPQDEPGIWDVFDALCRRKDEVLERSLTPPPKDVIG